ncbi:MAG TPA: HAMP domain-containing sensor histidine kinase [Methanospirillum sp.]|uniref:HAMP domain-containing sensor histidine kinase n=3 Tax=Methanospirillum sp. TaxID=45200 RepID=UPI002C64D114|nr:HAMP domain-containing sensor histidine kinase [Methanospirillum sp.]HOJ95229.1 HAMP domain-containing sensor histidine kinase [Methanospirillum sp.]
MSRIGKNQYQFGKYSLSYHIMLIFIIVGSISTGILFTYLYHIEKESIKSEFLISQQYGEESLINAIQLADQSFSFYDNAYNQPLKIALQRFQDLYHEQGSRPEDTDLESIRKDISIYFDLPIDLYIFNASGVIIASTFEPDIGLNFSYAPKFLKRLNDIRLGDTVAYDAIVTGTKLGEERKYAYIPTRDHEYILEIGINMQEFFKKQGLSKYPRLARWYGRIWNDVSSVWIYDQTYQGAEDIKTAIPGFSIYPYEFEDRKDRIDNLKKAFTGRMSFIVPGPGSNQITKYLYIPQINSSSVSSDLFDKVAEIVYSTERITKKTEQALIRNVLSAFLSIILLFLIAYAISRYVTRPVYQIIEDIEIIANGNYDHPIRRTKGFEFRRLETSIQKMVGRLKKDIISIKQRTDELHQELVNRQYAEQSLRAANHKLSLLGTITRHDLLNQISVVSSGFDLLEEDIPKNEQHNRIMSMIRDALNSIHDLILFTRIYEQMGVDKPVWHHMTRLIDEIMKNFSEQKCSVDDTTNGLEIYADPMFDRVLYNLIENSFRHGGTVTRIAFHVITENGIAVLTYSDNGRGIPGEDKEKIFARGYGTNTGLGLFLIREILSLTGIEIREIGKEGEGACFEIRIPEGKWRLHDASMESNGN